MATLTPELTGLADETSEARSRELWSLLLLTAVGLAARIGFLLLEPPVELSGDEPTWTMLGVRWVAGLHRPFSPFNPHLIFYPPAYPYFIAAVYAALRTLKAVKWVQAVAGAMLVPAVGRVGALAFSPRVGLLAAGVVALYPELVWFAVHFWAETLFLVLLWWAFERGLAARASGRTGIAVAAGVLWGLTVLTRETVLYFAPAMAVGLAWPRTGETRRPRPALAAGFLAALIATVGPWTCRNWIVFHAFVPVSTFGAHSLWQGNTLLPREEFERQADSVPGAIPQYRLAWKQGWEAIRERQPSWLLEKLRKEVPEFWTPESYVLDFMDNGAYGPIRRRAVPLVCAATMVPYLAVLALAVAGLAALRLTADRALLLAFAVYYNGLHVLTFGDARFRLAVMPVLFLLAAQAWTAWRAGTFPVLGPRRRALLGILVLLAAAVVIPGLVAVASAR